MLELRVGLRLRSTVCDTEVVVVRAPTDAVDLTCGGAPMLPADEAGTPSGAPAADAADGTLLGKRYADETGTLELLCTKAGAGSLELDGSALPQKAAKPLPSSD
jgi:hypothetical protein